MQKKNAKSNLDKYLSDTLTKGWAEVEVKKTSLKKVKDIEKSTSVKAVQDKKQQERLEENLNKSENEHLYSKLPEAEKSKYLALAQNVVKKHATNLQKMNCDEETLAYSVFAVSNDRYYNKSIEMYISQMLNKSLNVRDYLV